MKRRSLVILVATLFLLPLRAGIATASPPSASQILGQVAQSEQLAQSAALAQQQGIPNANLPARVLSPGDRGSRAQANNAAANSQASNTNATNQAAGQNQTGAAGGTGNTGIQAAGQSNQNAQQANSGAAAAQNGASNRNISVRVLSPGNDGAVSQQNNAAANSQASNTNATNQAAGQNQTGAAGGTGNTGIQAAGQSNQNAQEANSGALAVQMGASNVNVPVRVLSPGDKGSVSQQNNAAASSQAGNANTTTQAAGQEQVLTPTARPTAVTTPSALAPQGRKGVTKTVTQGAERPRVTRPVTKGATKTVVRGVGAPARAAPSTRAGGQGVTTAQPAQPTGQVTQAPRTVTRARPGAVTRRAVTTPSARQVTRPTASTARGPSAVTGCPAVGTQAIGQAATNGQLANSAGIAFADAVNAFIPVAVLSPGSGGPTAQQNDVSSSSRGQNENGTTQAAGQQQTGAGASCVAGAQTVGQSAGNRQVANSAAAVIQTGAHNTSAPARVLSPGSEGAVSQQNNVSANSTAENVNETIQAAGQTQVGGGAGAIQSIGQSAASSQTADSVAIAAQLGRAGVANISAPVRVLSDLTLQANDVAASSASGNANSLIQAAGQTQGG